MSAKSIRNKEAIMRHVQRERAAGRSSLPGFGMAFTKALVEPVPLQSAELVTNTLRAPTPLAYVTRC